MAWKEANKYIITFDGAKVDEDLEYFPFVVALDGTNHPDFFAELGIDPDDDFTGNDGDDIDLDRWQIADPDCDIQSNQCYMEEAGGYCRVNSRTKFQGDFDIQIDFNGLLNSNAYSWTVEMTAVSMVTGYWAKIRRCYDAAQYYRPQSWNGTTHTLASIGTSHSSGKFRITRVGTTTKLWYWTGSAWTEAATDTYNCLGSDEIYIQLTCGSWGGNPLTKVWWDNFTVNSAGGLNYSWRRKRVSFWAGGDQYTGKRCQAEIEKYDSANEEAVYHVSAPILKAGQDTELFLYFDKTQHHQNTYDLNADFIDGTFLGTQMSTQEANDDFAGTNDDPPDEERWETTGDATIQGNELSLDATPSQDAFVLSKFCLSGDFDIQIDFNDVVAGTVDYQGVGIQITQDSDNLAYVRAGYKGGLYFISNTMTGGSWGAEGNAARTNDYGKLRIFRSGSNITIQKQDGAESWQDLITGRACWSGMVVIYLRAWHVSAACTGDVDNFTVNSALGIYRNGELPDPTAWAPTGLTPAPYIEFNKLYCKGEGGSYRSQATKAYITGDFDIQVDFELLDPPDTDSWSVWLNVGTKDSWYHRVMRQYRAAGGGDGYCHTSWDLVSWYREGEFTRDDLTGKLRFTRSGDTFTSYAWYNSQWNIVATSSYAKTTRPVKIQLGCSSGGTGPDIEAYFDNLVINSTAGIIDLDIGADGFTGDLLALEDVADDFTGTDTDPPDPEKWRVNVGTPQINSNKCRFSVDSGGTGENMEAKWQLTGDFDLQIDWTGITYPATAGYALGLQARTKDDDRVSLSFGYDLGHFRYLSQYYDGTWHTVQEDTTTDTAGKFRLVRVDDTITFYTWNGSSWDSRGSSTQLGTAAVYIWITGSTWGGYPTATVDFDNFVVNSAGTIRRNFDVPDRTKWLPLPYGTYELPYLYDNKLRVESESGVAANFYQRYRTVLSGDFDIRINLDLTTAPSTDNWYFNFQLNFADGCVVQCMRMYSTSAGHRARYSYYTDTWYQQQETETGTSLVLRIARTGSNVSCYRSTDNGATWDEIGSAVAISTEDCWMILRTTTGGSNPAVLADWDNLWILDVDGISAFIDDIGGYPAQMAWDFGFSAVYHMAQDPTGGAGAIKDSTVYELHGTAQNMEATDLIDGKIGKALDFDGAAEYIDLGSDAGLAPATDITVEGLVKTPSSWPGSAANPQILARCTGTEDGYNLFLNRPDLPANRKWGFILLVSGYSWADDYALGTTVAQLDTWYYVAGKRSGTALAIRLNDTEDGTDTGNSGDIDYGATPGAQIARKAAEASTLYDGPINEVRLSKIVRSDAWLDATYYSLFNTLVTLVLASEYTQPLTPSIYSITELYKTTCTLNGSTFSDPDGHGHEASQWQVDLQTEDFSTPEVDSGETSTYLTSYPVTGLTGETDYKARVRYKDDSGDPGTEWSEWSDPANFTTKGDWTGIVFANRDPVDQEKQVQNDRVIKIDITDNWYFFAEEDLEITIEGEPYTNLDPETSYQNITDGKRFTWTPPFNYDYGRGNEVNVRVDVENSHGDQTYTQWAFFGFWHLTIKDGQLHWMFRQLNVEQAQLLLSFRHACEIATQVWFKFRYASGLLNKGAAETETSFIIMVKPPLYGEGEPTVFICELKRQWGQGSANIAEAEIIAGEASANIYGAYFVISGGQANIQAFMFFVVPAGSADIVVDYVSQAEAAANIGIPTEALGEGSALIFKKTTGAWIRINAIPAQVKQALEEAGVTIDA